VSLVRKEGGGGGLGIEFVVSHSQKKEVVMMAPGPGSLFGPLQVLHPLDGGKMDATVSALRVMNGYT
jgi:hypothetical protein